MTHETIRKIAMIALIIECLIVGPYCVAHGYDKWTKMEDERNGE